MPDYRVYLHDGPDTAPATETLAAEDDTEALLLAEMRLLLTSRYTHAVVARGASKIGSLKRDSQDPLDEIARN